MSSTMEMIIAASGAGISASTITAAINRFWNKIQDKRLKAHSDHLKEHDVQIIKLNKKIDDNSHTDDLRYEKITRSIEGLIESQKKLAKGQLLIQDSLAEAVNVFTKFTTENQFILNALKNKLKIKFEP